MKFNQGRERELKWYQVEKIGFVSIQKKLIERWWWWIFIVLKTWQNESVRLWLGTNKPNQMQLPDNADIRLAWNGCRAVTTWIFSHLAPQIRQFFGVVTGVHWHFWCNLRSYNVLNGSWGPPNGSANRILDISAELVFEPYAQLANISKAKM